MKIIQLQVVPVPNVYETQCNAYMYALTDTGDIYFKRDNEDKWIKESEIKLDKK